MARTYRAHPDPTLRRPERGELGETVRMNVVVPTDLRAAVEERARREKMSLSAAIRDALEQWAVGGS